MVESQQAGFPARGNTLYVFSLDQDSFNGGPGMKQTEVASPPQKPGQ
jgi:hypothetical protein